MPACPAHLRHPVGEAQSVREPPRARQGAALENALRAAAQPAAAGRIQTMQRSASSPGTCKGST